MLGGSVKRPSAWWTASSTKSMPCSPIYIASDSGLAVSRELRVRTVFRNTSRSLDGPLSMHDSMSQTLQISLAVSEESSFMEKIPLSLSVN